MDKAKAYDEALKRAKEQRDDYQKELDKTDKNSQLANILRTGISAVEMIFLQLKDSDDERISLEEFTEKIEDWKARFSYPDSIPVKATMAFTARMFYMYPDIAREWYGNLPKATQD